MNNKQIATVTFVVLGSMLLYFSAIYLYKSGIFHFSTISSQNISGVYMREERWKECIDFASQTCLKIEKSSHTFYIVDIRREKMRIVQLHDGKRIDTGTFDIEDIDSPHNNSVAFLPNDNGTRWFGFGRVQISKIDGDDAVIIINGKNTAINIKKIAAINNALVQSNYDYLH